MKWECDDENDGQWPPSDDIHYPPYKCWLPSQPDSVCVFVVNFFVLLLCLERCLFVCFILSSFFCVARCPPVGPPANLTATVQTSVSAVSTDAPTLAEKVTMQLTFVVRPIQLFFSLFYNAIMIRWCSSSSYSLQNTRRRNPNREQLLLQLVTAMTSQRYRIQYWTNLFFDDKSYIYPLITLRSPSQWDQRQLREERQREGQQRRCQVCTRDLPGAAGDFQTGIETKTPCSSDLQFSIKNIQFILYDLTNASQC